MKQPATAPRRSRASGGTAHRNLQRQFWPFPGNRRARLHHNFSVSSTLPGDWARHFQLSPTTGDPASQFEYSHRRSAREHEAEPRPSFDIPRTAHRTFTSLLHQSLPGLRLQCYTGFPAVDPNSNPVPETSFPLHWPG